MIRIDNTDVYGFRHALRAMRDPMDSWGLSDSKQHYCDPLDFPDDAIFDDGFSVGPKDRELFMKLVKGGTEHRKHLRFLNIYVTLTLPRYVWTELDTYKVGLTRLSCSTMHKLGHTELTNDDFQVPPLPEVLVHLNSLGKQYRDGGKKDYDLVRQMKAHLPESFLQKADLCLNYETAINMFRQRKNHRLEEWRYDPRKPWFGSICNWIASLPLMYEILEVAGFINEK